MRGNIVIYQQVRNTMPIFKYYMDCFLSILAEHLSLFLSALVARKMINILSYFILQKNTFILKLMLNVIMSRYIQRQIYISIQVLSSQIIFHITMYFNIYRYIDISIAIYTYLSPVQIGMYTCIYVYILYISRDMLLNLFIGFYTEMSLMKNFVTFQCAFKK